MINLIALGLGIGYLLADRHMALWMAGRRPEGLISRIIGGRVRTDP
jgi:hypothetical protein